MLLNRCSLKKREHQSSPSVRDSPEEKRLRHVRLFVMKGTPQRISSISWFSWKHEYSAKCVRYFHQRNIWVHNFQKEIRKSITESHAPFFFSFCSWHSQLFTAQTEFDSCIPLSFQTKLHMRHHSSGLLVFSVLLLAYSHTFTDTGPRDIWRALQCWYNPVAEHLYQFRAAGLQMTKSIANLLLGNSKK